MRDYDREQELRNEDRYADFLMYEQEYDEEVEEVDDDREDERQSINREKRSE